MNKTQIQIFSRVWNAFSFYSFNSIDETFEEKNLQKIIIILFYFWFVKRILLTNWKNFQKMGQKQSGTYNLNEQKSGRGKPNVELEDEIAFSTNSHQMENASYSSTPIQALGREETSETRVASIETPIQITEYSPNELGRNEAPLIQNDVCLNTSSISDEEVNVVTKQLIETYFVDSDSSNSRREDTNSDVHIPVCSCLSADVEKESEDTSIKEMVCQFRFLNEWLQ